MSATPEVDAARGFVYAATGEVYVTLARRAARSLRLIHPDAEIDLFTDVELNDPVFSRIYRLEDNWFRPKMESLLRSRFERTIFMDADTMVVASFTPVFDVLDRFDVAACHDRYLNNSFGRQKHTKVLPAAFGVLNGGMLAIRRTDEVHALMSDWESELKRTGAKRDQPILRELIYNSNVRLCVLPPGYNFLTFHELKTWWGMFGAPRVLHAAHLHRRRGGPGDPTKPFTIEELIGWRHARRVRALIHADFDLNPDAELSSRRMNSPDELGVMRAVRKHLAPIWHSLRER